jgi:hypothetical protein
MTDDRDERLLLRAADSLRGIRPGDDDALASTLAAIRRVADDGARVARGHGLARVARVARRRRPFVTRGTARFVAGLAAGVAFAAGLGLGLWAGWRMRGESIRLAAAEASAPALGSSAHALDARADATPQPVQFMLVAPSATRVALVGEFNDWDPAATPMVRASGGAWHVALPLARGRHVYAFVVDGTSWVTDPQAPLAPERWFGASNSVLLVNGGKVQ